ncbi:MAG: hypothetical protein PHC53_02575 [Patescibacteria group bacterium]|nr:hypothetical protein [Patescibacteria group bacterium]
MSCPHCNYENHDDCVKKERLAVVKKVEKFVTENYNKHPEAKTMFDQLLTKLNSLAK